ncbi:hypothetical protein LAZ40_06890 [Cereibacter sphaeroides]|uniref:hypothetical protein n=1 Tax=Cereibacter sphaeroides TaxID=1063 RepID=UPI001F1E8441|nr:hypothetical protein [Cereibacter sphaeroides]MCE6958773.1 hypothetical protein [Cereibacter sphaeroides]MCE6973353.1 hypothetical protein [Cereibacter sphaeroides]
MLFPYAAPQVPQDHSFWAGTLPTIPALAKLESKWKALTSGTVDPATVLPENWTMERTQDGIRLLWQDRPVADFTRTIWRAPGQAQAVSIGFLPHTQNAVKHRERLVAFLGDVAEKMEQVIQSRPFFDDAMEAALRDLPVPVAFGHETPQEQTVEAERDLEPAM